MFSAPTPKSISAKKDQRPSAFKTLMIELLSHNGEFSKLRESLRNAKIKCLVKHLVIFYSRFKNLETHLINVIVRITIFLTTKRLTGKISALLINLTVFIKIN